MQRWINATLKAMPLDPTSDHLGVRGLGNDYSRRVGSLLCVVVKLVIGEMVLSLLVAKTRLLLLFDHALTVLLICGFLTFVPP